MLERSEALDRLLSPARVAIVGAPNVGKSTLANALLGRPMSITSEQAGTTRDWVDAVAVIAVKPEAGSQKREVAAPVVLVDTAGVRETGDALEVESIARTHVQARGAKVVMVVLDATRGVGEAEKELLAAYEDAARVVAINKMDLAGMGGAGATAQEVRGAARVSALEGTGLGELMGAVLEKLGLGELGEDEPWAFTMRQKRLLRRAAECGSREEAAGLTRELIGEKR